MTAAGWYRRHGKRIFDVAIAAPAVVLLAPVAACVAVLVRVSLGSPVLFRQVRPGLHGSPFTILKFRTMSDGRDEAGRLLPDAGRLTAIGRLLRATSLDELPELWNVLTGDMSLVGPRPLLMEYLPRYSPSQARRHEVRPGITGLAQVSGRNALGWPERFELDREYVERCSLALDLSILARTAAAVLSRRGISQPGRATVDYFEGTVVRHAPQNEDSAARCGGPHNGQGAHRAPATFGKLRVAPSIVEGRGSGAGHGAPAPRQARGGLSLSQAASDRAGVRGRAPVK